MDTDALASLLRDTRAIAGLSRRALAERVGISESYIGLLETGRKWEGLTTRHLSALADALGWDALRRASVLAAPPSRAQD